MEPNPYASPASHPIERPAKKKRSQFAFASPFTLGLFLMCATLPYAGNEGIFNFPGTWQTHTKLLLAESAITAILGIAAFSSLGGKLGRAVCLSQLVVTATMVPMLVHTRWSARYTYILPTLLAFACINLLFLHFAIRRFERSSWRANWTLGAMAIVDVGIIGAEYLRPSLGWLMLQYVLRELGLDFGQGTVCVLLWLRMRDARRIWRLEQGQESNDHAQAQAATPARR